MAKAPKLFDVPIGSESCKELGQFAVDTGVPNNESGVNDAYYPFPNKPHGHHLQDASKEVALAAYSVNDGVKAEYQENMNHDETEK